MRGGNVYNGTEVFLSFSLELLSKHANNNCSLSTHSFKYSSVEIHMSLNMHLLEYACLNTHQFTYVIVWMMLQASKLSNAPVFI